MEQKLWYGNAGEHTRFGESKQALTQSGVDPSSIKGPVTFDGDISGLNVIGETNVQGGAGVEQTQTGLETEDNKE